MNKAILILFLFTPILFSQTNKNNYVDKNNRNVFRIYNSSGKLLYEFTNSNTDSSSLETLRNSFSRTPDTLIVNSFIKSSESGANPWIIILTVIIVILTFIYSFVSYLTYRATRPILKGAGTQADGKLATVNLINSSY